MRRPCVSRTLADGALARTCEERGQRRLRYATSTWTDTAASGSARSARTTRPPGAPGAPGGRGGQAGQAAGRGGRGGGARPTVPPEFDGLPIWKLDPAKLIAMVRDPKSTVFQKAIRLQEAGLHGAETRSHPWPRCLMHPQLSCYARFGLEPNPDPSVDEALRAAFAEGDRKDTGRHHHLDRRPQGCTGAGRRHQADGFLRFRSSRRRRRSRRDDRRSPSLAQPPGGARPHQGSVFAVTARACLLCAEGLMATNRPARHGTVLATGGH